MPKVYRCLYCGEICYVKKLGGKDHIDCKHCGIKELTPLGLARMEGKAEFKK